MKSLFIKNAMRALARAVSHRDHGYRVSMRIGALMFRSNLAEFEGKPREANRLYKTAMGLPIL